MSIWARFPTVGDAPQPPLPEGIDTSAYVTREVFIQLQLPAIIPAFATTDGFIRQDRKYVAVTCRCGLKGCQGWNAVHDDPDARRHWQRLFNPKAEGFV